jgi:hypothetical protein
MKTAFQRVVIVANRPNVANKVLRAQSRSVSTYSDLSDEHKMMYEMSRNFAETELMPIAGEKYKE